MAKLFNNLTTDDLEQSTDFLGGRNVFPSGCYIATIKAMYTSQAKSGAWGVTVLADIEGKPYTETIYITNKEGKNYFLNKQDPTKKVPLPGFTLIDDLCLIGTEKPLSEQEWEEKVHMVYDPDVKKEVPTSLETDMDLIGKKVGLCILNEKVDKTKLEGNEYVPTGETFNKNRIVKIYHPELKLTVAEARDERDATFVDKWNDKFKDVEVDNSKGVSKSTNNGTEGSPFKSQSSAAPRKSLFGNKK